MSCVVVWCCCVWCCCVCGVVVCGVCVWCVVCDTLKKPVCPLHTSLCVRSIRPSVYNTTRTHVETCVRGAGTNGEVLNVHTESVLYIDRGQGVNVSSAYQNLPTYGLSRASEVHQRNPWILHILRKGRAQSLNAPFLPVAMYSSYETGTLFRLFVQRPSLHFFLALSSSIFV